LPSCCLRTLGSRRVRGLGVDWRAGKQNPPKAASKSGHIEGDVCIVTLFPIPVSYLMNYSEPGVPRLNNGRVNLSATAPRTAIGSGSGEPAGGGKGTTLLSSIMLGNCTS